MEHIGKDCIDIIGKYTHNLQMCELVFEIELVGCERRRIERKQQYERISNQMYEINISRINLDDLLATFN